MVVGRAVRARRPKTIVKDCDEFELFLRDRGVDSMDGSSSGINRLPRLDWNQLGASLFSKAASSTS